MDSEWKNSFLFITWVYKFKLLSFKNINKQPYYAPITSSWQDVGKRTVNVPFTLSSFIMMIMALMKHNQEELLRQSNEIFDRAGTWTGVTDNLNNFFTGRGAHPSHNPLPFLHVHWYGVSDMTVIRSHFGECQWAVPVVVVVCRPRSGFQRSEDTT